MAVVCGLAAVAACSSSASVSPTTSVTRSSVVATSTTAAATTTASTAAVTTAAPTSTSAASTTTADPVAAAEPAVRALIKAATDDFSACLVAMPTCDVATLSATRAGPLLERNKARIQEWNAAGYTVRNRDRFRYVIESVTVNPGASSASAVVCIADGSRLVKPGAGPGGADVVVDETYGSGRETWDIRLDADGRWRVYDAPALGPTESRDVCPAS